MLIRERLAAELGAALERARAAGEVEAGPVRTAPLDVPPTPELGAFSSDLAVSVAKLAQQPAATVAGAIIRHLPTPAGILERVEASPSGILNLHLRADWLRDVLAEIQEQGAEYGRETGMGEGHSVLIEFVSAYPTGPLTVSHGRGAALGDALANVLEWSGFRVARETYVNDAGGHMDRFARSLESRYLQAWGQHAPLPLDGYSSEYLVELARELRHKIQDSLLALPQPERVERLLREGVEAVLEKQRATLSRLGIRFDAWYSESDLHQQGRIEAVVQRLRESGDIYDLDGAVWLRSTAHGDEQDRPLIRSNGRPSYLAGDLAYHLDKRERGYELLIDIWNAEHEGYARRTRAGLHALGIEASALEILIFQGVALKLQGSILEAGAIGGNTVLLEDVIEEVGAEVARFFYLRRPAGSPLEFDLDLARLQTAENPFFAVRETVRRTGEIGAAGSLEGTESPAEVALLHKLAALPDEIRAAARERDPYRLTRYAQETAAAYAALEQEGAAGETPTGNRRVLAQATHTVLSNTLTVLGAS